MKESDKKVFFANKKVEPTVIKNFGNKLSLSNFPEENRIKILDRLAEKDKLMSRGHKGEVPGIKINGKQITRDNIHEFEKEVKIEKSKVVKVKESKHTKESLLKLSFSKLKDIAEALGETGRSSSGLIKDILKHN